MVVLGVGLFLVSEVPLYARRIPTETSRAQAWRGTADQSAQDVSLSQHTLDQSMMYASLAGPV